MAREVCQLEFDTEHEAKCHQCLFRSLNLCYFLPVQVVFDPDVEGQASPIYDMEMSGGPMGSDVYVFDRIWLKLGDSGRHSYEHITIKPGNGVNDTAG